MMRAGQIQSNKCDKVHQSWSNFKHVIEYVFCRNVIMHPAIGSTTAEAFPKQCYSEMQVGYKEASNVGIQASLLSVFIAREGAHASL